MYVFYVLTVHRIVTVSMKSKGDMSKTEIDELINLHIKYSTEDTRIKLIPQNNMVCSIEHLSELNKHIDFLTKKEGVDNF